MNTEAKLSFAPLAIQKMRNIKSMCLDRSEKLELILFKNIVGLKNQEKFHCNNLKKINYVEHKKDSGNTKSIYALLITKINGKENKILVKRPRFKSS